MMTTEQDTTELATVEPTAVGLERGTSSVFTGISGFEEAQRIANALSHSTIVPEIFQRYPDKKPENHAAMANCLIALEMAQRSRESPLVIMQNLYVVKGKPSFAAVYLIAKVNSSAAFSRLMWEVTGTLGGADYAVRAYATLLATGEALLGPWITPAMVKGEGWLSNSKWVNMPEQMYRYRAATFWARTFAPDITMGMQTVEEVEDVSQGTEARSGNRASARDLNARIRQDIAAANPESTEGEGGEAVDIVETEEAPEPAQDDVPPADTETTTHQPAERTRRAHRIVE